MKPISVTGLARIVGGRLVDPDVDRMVGPLVCIDSRKAEPGALFVAFLGEAVDGHDYIAAASARGAAAALCQRVPEGLAPEVAAGCVIVDDPTKALGLLARHIVDDVPGLTIIGVTGSQGKTSTKDLLAQILAPSGPGAQPDLRRTVAPEGSFNNEIGVPLTATRVEPDTGFLISEMGARGIGHVAYLCGLTPPTIGVVLNVGRAHVGEFGSQDAIAEAKGELVRALPADGWAVLNGTDPRVAAMAARTSARIALFSPGGRPGQPADLRVWATDQEPDDLDRYSFTLCVEVDDQVTSAPVTMQLIGRHQVANATASAAAALASGLDLAEVAAGLSQARLRSRWRMEVTERSDDVVVVNDSYNANPDSMLAACEVLSTMLRRRRRSRPGIRGWAVLGQMHELGDSSRAEHEAIGRAAGSLQIDNLIAIGADAPAMVEAARRAGCDNAVVAEDTAGAMAHLRPAPGDLVLVKASRAEGLERVAEQLLAADADPGDGDTTGETL